MRTRLVRPLIGRLAGTVQTVPVAVAERLVEQGQAEALTDKEVRTYEHELEMLTGDRSAQHRDPRRPERG